ncbi:MAG: cytochrome c oxidase subunit II [Planctomycetota bacterium]
MTLFSARFFPTLLDAVTPASWSWLPPQYSTYAAGIDWLFWFIMWVSLFFFVLIVVLMVYFTIKYRRRDESDPPGHGATHNGPLELAWSVIPMVLALMMFWWGLDEWVAMATPPPDAYQVEVTAAQWSWSFAYPNGGVSNELHCWVGKPVRLLMRSDDVLHALFIPVFRTKMDIVPDRWSEAWFTPTADSVGEHRLFCAEYCGQSHYDMKTSVVVHATQEDFQTWVDNSLVMPPGTPLAVWGQSLYESRGCKGCHTLTEQRGQGPGWLETSKLLATKGKRQFEAGAEREVNVAYLQESIKEPKKEVVKSFRGVMPTPRRFSDQDIEAVIEFIKSLAPEEKKP